jgi:hypothetical protein
MPSCVSTRSPLSNFEVGVRYREYEIGVIAVGDREQLSRDAFDEPKDSANLRNMTLV